MIYKWNEEKNRKLKSERNISFEDAVIAIGNNKILDYGANPKKEKYPNQEIFILETNGYVYIVPYIYENKKTIFLKTIIPSRKLTKKYFKE